ncbi:hypothetical protein PI125_g21065 [Phytophthora idaei]|nr:hypothetical protein PI125_g21065 [Phytophthora idaei]KAG3132941.1 hypothetical protein PI126_g19397 [Phytophthora idaei]
MGFPGFTHTLLLALCSSTRSAVGGGSSATHRQGKLVSHRADTVD